MTFLAIRLLLGGWLKSALTFLKSLPWWVWASVALGALLVFLYQHAERKGEAKGAAKANVQIQKDHTRTVAEAVADSGKAQVTANAIGDQVKHTNQLATDFVQSKIEDMHHALDVPPATPGGPPPPVDTVGVSASIDGLIDRANRAAEAADAEP